MAKSVNKNKSVKTKALPKFRNEDEERAFWAAHDSTGYIDWSKGERVALSNLKPSLKTISLRLPEATITELKMLANRRDVPYQSLLKVFPGGTDRPGAQDLVAGSTPEVSLIATEPFPQDATPSSSEAHRIPPSRVGNR
jgi:predicted DNA binding CopG/RHH family protein